MIAAPGTIAVFTAGLWSAGADVPLVALALLAATASVTGALSSWHRTLRRPVRPDEQRGGRALAATTRRFAAQGPAGQIALLAGEHWASAARGVVPVSRHGRAKTPASSSRCW